MDIIMVGACYLDTILTQVLPSPTGRSPTDLTSLSPSYLVRSVPHYPDEDTKLRASSLQVRRGGNCANSLEVLQQLVVRPGDGRRLHLVACLPRSDSPATQQVMRSFSHNDDGDDDAAVTAVSFRHCVYRDEATEAASSYIIRSGRTGSRTLVNYNPLAEMTAAEFRVIARDFPPEGKSWWHFEGRIPLTTLECIRILRDVLPGCKISVEVEKPGREGLRALAAEADVVFYSKAWVEDNGYDSAMACLTTEPRGQASLSLCPWGAGGAYAMSHASGEQIYCPVEQITVVDSVGAGDTFIAGMLFGLTTAGGDGDDDAAWDVHRCVRFAVDLATLKVQREGFAGLGETMLNYARKKRPGL